jgi:hypothetical protein
MQRHTSAAIAESTMTAFTQSGSWMPLICQREGAKNENRSVLHCSRRLIGSVLFFFFEIMTLVTSTASSLFQACILSLQMTPKERKKCSKKTCSGIS